jgi:hypothetical protein
MYSHDTDRQIEELGEKPVTSSITNPLWTDPGMNPGSAEAGD